MKIKILEKYTTLCGNYKIEPKPQIVKYLKLDNEDDDFIDIMFPGNVAENYNNRIQLEDLHPLISSLITFGPNVRYVDLSFNRFGHKSGIYFEKLFDYATNVISIKLRGNNIDDIACSSLVKILLEKNNLIEELDLNTNCIGNLGVMAITKLIFKKPTLQKLDLGHNYYDWDGLIAINYALKPSIKKSKIKVDNNQLNNALIDGLSNDIYSSNKSKQNKLDLIDETKYTYLPKLKVLNLDDPQYRDNDQDFFTHFGKMLLSNEYLEKLSLRFHKLRFEGCKIIFHHMESNSSLQILDLSNNQICFQGISYITEFLIDKSDRKEKKKVPNLVSLNLSGNHIHNQGAIILSEGISKNCTLVYIDISNNGIKNDGLFKLAEGLFENKTIQFFKAFKGNHWGKTSISVFRDLVDVKENFYPDFEIYEHLNNDIQICYNENIQADEEEYVMK